MNQESRAPGGRRRNVRANCLSTQRNFDPANLQKRRQFHGLPTKGMTIIYTPQMERKVSFSFCYRRSVKKIKKNMRRLDTFLDSDWFATKFEKKKPYEMRFQFESVSKKACSAFRAYKFRLHRKNCQFNSLRKRNLVNSMKISNQLEIRETKQRGTRSYVCLYRKYISNNIISRKCIQLCL